MNLLNCLGTGIVASTKDTNTNEIMVYLPGFFPGAEGRVLANTNEVENVAINANGDRVSAKTLRSNVVPATWRNMGDNNRITAPDVREGSQVAIYQIAGQNRFYWTLDGVNANTFRLETVFYGWSANPKVDEQADFDIDNFYIFKVSTHEGLITLRTSMANGEPTAFDIQVNTADGVVSVAGNQENLFVLDDMRHSLTYQNVDGSVVDVEKKNMSIQVPDTLNLFATENINIKTKTLNLQAEEMNVDVKLTRWKGKIERTGDTEQTGDYDQSGNYKQQGDTTRTGMSTSTGKVHSDTDVTSKISLNNHVHPGVMPGPASTQPGTGM